MICTKRNPQMEMINKTDITKVTAYDNVKLKPINVDSFDKIDYHTLHFDLLDVEA